MNDTLGHNAGDALLVEVARRLQDAVRASDTVGRLGSEEFECVLSQLAQPEDAALVAEKIVSALLRPVHFQGREIAVSPSVGIGVYPTPTRTPCCAARHRHDQAKRPGRNAYRFYDPSR